MKDVCVIGAGVGGLVATRYLKERFRVTVYEATDAIGGVWLYNKDSNAKKQTPMYKNLRTNLPKQLMVFRDLPHEPGVPTFQNHSQVMSYLNRYCDLFKIRSFIQFDTPVISLKPDLSSDPLKWLVETKSGVTKFDAVALCTGRYDTPHIPKIEGIDTYTGTYIHSKDYSVPEDFNGKSVLVVGAKSSGIDIVIDLSTHGVKVAVSHRCAEPLMGILDSVTQHSEPIEFSKSGVFFKDDVQEHCFDVIIFATGYGTNLGFVDPSCELHTDILPRPLYRYLLNPKYPTMAIFNQCYSIAPFPFVEYQVMYYRDVLLGKIELCNENDRKMAANKLLLDQGDKPLKYRYQMRYSQFPYNAENAAYCGVSLENTLDMNALAELYDIVAKDRAMNPMLYRNKEYVFNTDEACFELAM